MNKNQMGRLCVCVNGSARVRVWMCTPPPMSTPLPGCQSVHLPTCVHASVKAGAKNRRVWGRGGSAVSQCCLSRKLMGARGGAVGRPEPCTIQASFIWSATTGAKQHTARYNTHIYARGHHTHSQKDCIVQPVRPRVIQTQTAGGCPRAVFNSPAAHRTIRPETKFGRTKGRTQFQTFLSLFFLAQSVHFESLQGGVGRPEYSAKGWGFTRSSKWRGRPSAATHPGTRHLNRDSTFWFGQNNLYNWKQRGLLMDLLRKQF